jgi:predicted dienelactone hydrolase
LIVALLSLIPTSTTAAMSTDDVMRAVTAIYDDSIGAVTGDANADGSATAADLAAVIAGFRNPTWPGPYRAGATILPLVKPSETTGMPRVLDTVVWYPTDADAPDDLYHAIRDAPFASAIAPRPLLVFSHGSCGSPAQSQFLTAHLARYGVIVAAPPHPGNRLGDPNCNGTAAQLDSYFNRVADVMFVIDALLAANHEIGSPLFDAVDRARVGVAGHSFGGQTTLRVAFGEPRVIAGLALAPTIAAIAGLAPQIRIPIMIQGSEFDTLTPFETHQQAIFDLLAPPKYLLEILDSGHFAYSDGCFLGFSDCGAGRLTQEQAHQYVLRYAVAYVLQYVAGDPQFERFLTLTATPPGARFTPSTAAAAGG